MLLLTLYMYRQENSTRVAPYIHTESSEPTTEMTLLGAGNNVKKGSRALVACSIWLGLLALFAFAIPQASDYLAAGRLKHQRLASISSPKIILVGGSNLAFGVDSTKLGEALNRPVVNMGLRSSLGLSYMLNEVRSYVQHGDIIVLCPEPKLLYETVSADGSIILESLLVYPEGIQYVDFGELFDPSVSWLRCLKQVYSTKARIYKYKVNAWVANGFKTWPMEETYCCSGFDSKGDHVAHLHRNSQWIDPATAVPDNGNDKNFTTALNKIEKFGAYATSRGARVVFVMPPFPAGPNYYDKREGLYRKMYKEIGVLSTITLVSSQDRYILDPKLFYDTVNHLNAQGRSARTDRMVQDLQTWLSHHRE